MISTTLSESDDVLTLITNNSCPICWKWPLAKCHNHQGERNPPLTQQNPTFKNWEASFSGQYLCPWFFAPNQRKREEGLIWTKPKLFSFPRNILSDRGRKMETFFASTATREKEIELWRRMKILRESSSFLSLLTFPNLVTLLSTGQPSFPFHLWRVVSPERSLLWQEVVREREKKYKNLDKVCLCC